MRIFISLVLPNVCLANFKYTNSYIRNVLLHKYCTAFNGSKIVTLFNNCMDDIYNAWRVAMHKICRVSWTTHCNLLPHRASVMHPELWFYKRLIRYIEIALNSDNVHVIVKTIINVGLNGTNTIICGNWRHVRSNYGMEECNVKKHWDEKCKYK